MAIEIPGETTSDHAPPSKIRNVKGATGILFAIFFLQFHVSCARRLPLIFLIFNFDIPVLLISKSSPPTSTEEHNIIDYSSSRLTNRYQYHYEPR
jgi:hypothetical protein